MPEEKKESRIIVEEIPQAEQELTQEEAESVKGGISGFGFGTSAKSETSKDPSQTA